MNRILIILVISHFFLNPVRGQNGYAKFIKNTWYKDKTIKCFKGEVVPIIEFSNSNRVSIIINNDTINNQRFPSSRLGKYQFLNLNYLADSKSFVVAKNNYIVVNAEHIDARDSVTLISESGQKILQLTGKRKDSVGKADFGKYLRLIIANTPSIYYLTDSLKSDTHLMQANEEKTNDWQTSFWKYIKPPRGYYAIIAFAIIMIWCLVRYFIRGKKRALSSLRIKTSFASGRPLYRETKRDKVVADPFQPFESTPVAKFEKLDSVISNWPEKPIVLPVPVVKNPVDQDGLNELNAELRKLRTENYELNTTIRRLNTEREQQAKDFDGLRAVHNEKKVELNNAREKLIEVDYLTGYCADVLSYFRLCDMVSADAYSCFNNISRQSIQHAQAPGELLMRFQNSIYGTRIGNWTQIVQDIADNGISSNIQVKNTLKRTDSIENKKRQFQRLLFDNVLVKYSSSVLVLAEAFRNLKYFRVAPDLIAGISDIFSAYITELIDKVKTTGLENKYVPLFTDYEVFIGQIQLANEEKSVAYREVKGLKKDTIAEIVSYGIRNEFDDTKTLIILN